MKSRGIMEHAGSFVAIFCLLAFLLSAPACHKHENESFELSCTPYVSDGDVLGTLLLATGSDITLLHFGVRWRPTTRFDCPLDYCSAEVKAQLQALDQRDHPG